MDIRKRKLIGCVALSILIIACLIMASAMTLSDNKNSVDGAVISNTANVEKKLLLDGYETRADKMVFDSDALTELYDKLTPSGVDGTLENVTAQAKTTDIRVEGATLHNGIGSDKIRSYNGGQNVVVNFGGLEWIVTSLTVTDDTKQDPIVTLWLKDSINVGYFNPYTSPNSSDFDKTYPSCMYSTSYMRAFVLNGYQADGTTKVQYAISNTAASDYTPQSNYRFEKFTRANVSGSLTKYLVQPKNVKYQKTEDLYILMTGITATRWSTNLGDSLNRNIPSNHFYSSTIHIDTAISTNTRYLDWGEDYLWVPSMVETGFEHYLGNSNGLWNSDASLRGGAVDYWTRSGGYGNANLVGKLGSASGTLVWSQPSSSQTYAFRPALHLNLREAQNASNAFDVPDTMSSTYDGNVVDLTKADWYRENFTDYVTIQCRNSTDTANATLKDAGTYKIKLTIKDKDKHVWLRGDRTDPVRIITYTINKQQVDFPEFDTSEKPYHGGADVKFELKEFDDDIINVNADGVAGVTYSKNKQEASASKVGEYRLNVSLKDTKNYAFKSTEELKFTVTPATVKVKILDVNGRITLNGTLGDKKSIKVDVDTVYLPYENQTAPLIITATKEESRTREISAVLTITHAGGILDHILDLDELSSAGKYTLGVKAGYNDGDEVQYKFELDESGATEITVEEEGNSTSLRWYLYESGTTQLKYKDAELGQKLVSYTPNLEYKKNVEYSFTARAPSGYELDDTYGNNGIYTVNSLGDEATGVSVDTYTTSVRLRQAGSTEEGEVYSIKWTIEKAKFDLSGVKWLYNGQLPYNGVAGIKAEIDPSTLPEGLIVGSCENNEGVDVGEYGSATVTFAVASGYEDYYIRPVQGDLDSYKFTASGSLTDFEWEKDWIIVQAEIKLGKGEWKNKTVTVGDNTFVVKELSDPKADGIVKYVYFETDPTGKVKDPTNELQLEDIEVSATERKHYVAYPKFINATVEQNYKFTAGLTDPDGYYSPHFAVGGGSTAVKVELKKYEFEYNNGKPVKVELDIKEGNASASNFTLTYYKDDVVESNKLDGAPSEVGKYFVVITSNSSSIILSDPTQFEFEITKAVLSTEWKEDYKPYVLNLKAGQINGIEYEIQDADGNVISEISQIKAGNYKIMARIKPDQLSNYIFDNDLDYTDWKEFEVKAGEEIKDPYDTSRYPAEEGDTPTDPTNPSDEDGDGFDFGKVGETLKQWWQVVASVISIVLIIAFVAKGIDYANKKKENKRLVEKYGTFYAAGLFGLSFTNWTIIACILMGVAVLSLVFMLLEKSGYKKTKRDVDDAKEEYDRRNKDEEMKRMFMMFGGNGMNGGMGGQGGFAYQGIGAEDIRGIVSETMTALLPGMQQMLPQQASSNDELVEKLIEQNEKLMQQLAEKPAEKEVASASISDETLDRLASRLQPSQSGVNDDVLEKLVNRLQPATNNDTILKVVEKTEHNDETIKQLLKNQEMLMEKIIELSNVKPAEPQVVVKEVPVEKIVEKEVKVEVPVEVEKVVEKVVEVPVEVEKIVEKEVVKEVKVEVPVEVEKVVEKIVEIPAEKPEPKAKKAPVPRLTLDEAYAKLSATQKKIFDTLKAYAMSKDKCKEKKSTYFIVLGQSTVNPLVKLTIKKNTTVAMFKMEDEYFKDIRRNAGSDGTKVKVKESEVVVGDMQALATAKEMIDLREDQIERYNEYLKEQKSLRKK